MRIARWNGPSNYGDDLNYYLWPKVLDPTMTSILPDALFLGIGSMLGQQMPPASHYVVFGSGAGYQGNPVFSTPVKTYFVRGPHTGKVMDAKHITDPAILMGRFHAKSLDPAYQCSFMPRWNSMGSVLTADVEAAGFHLIDPTGTVEKVTDEIANTALLLTEALHGAVVADSLGIPWICIRAQDGHDFKWYDWTASMNMVWNPIDAQSQGLTWAKNYAVPQLSARSVYLRKMSAILYSIDSFNDDVRSGRLFQ
jgi:succinoglycan biosynthesis protein ExoV